MSSEPSRRGRSKAAASLALIEAAYTVLEQQQPATVRAVCYRLFVSGVIPDMSRKSTRKVSEQLVWAREQGVIPWEWIVDETRSPERVHLWRDPDQIITAAVKTYRRDYWQDQPEWVEVWSEKGTVRGILQPVLDKYGVTFRVMHGYTSATVVNEVAEETRRREQRLNVLYMGDYDPSGLHMSVIDLPNRLSRYGGDVVLNRVALRDDDVEHLPDFPAGSKAGDARYQWFVKNYGHACWELDALPPNQLRDRAENEIKALLDLDAWNHAVTVETQEIASMSEFLTHWNSISGQGRKYPGGQG